MRLSITSTTGSLLELTVTQGESVEELRTHISKKLRLQTDRIVLLHKDRQLTTGKLQDLGVTDGSKLILVPVIESGLVCSTTRPERNLMDVLECLSDTQISEFLSGRCPLTVKLAVGSHMMYVQLQLSAKNVSELQKNQDLRAQSNARAQTAPPTTGINHPKINIPGAATLPASQTNGHSNSSDSSFATKCRHGSSAGTIFHAETCRHSSPHQPSPRHSTHPTFPVTANLPSASPYTHPSCPLLAATPVCTPRTMSGQQSPTPASSVEEVQAFFPAEVCKQPGAVIDSFMSHSPGVFSGTFSGTLTPECHTGTAVRHSRRGVNIILQILGDLLRAAYNQGGLLAHPHCLASSTTGSLLTTVDQTQGKGKTPQSQLAEQNNETSGEGSAIPSSCKQENHNLHHKLERLQLLMHQRRLHKQTRRSSRVSQISHPYHQHHNRS
ncbi:midnolin isoform X2 [Nelusetta ayraudi]|uniref:midnolin isoform X2 n=1 Tax=Nelusetta ayraudi TaxID=303726 RepID=UPI003F70D926